MKRAKKPTREQKIVIHNNLLNPDNWLVVKEDASYLYLVSRTSNQRRCVSKYALRRARKAK